MAESAAKRELAAVSSAVPEWWKCPVLGDWQPVWAWWGMVPREVVTVMHSVTDSSRAASSVLRRVQDALMTGTAAMWAARNSAVLQRELEWGVNVSKRIAVRSGWVRSSPSGRKRGRPPKALEDLAESSRRARDRAADKEEVTVR